jgi:hypothetical protein
MISCHFLHFAKTEDIWLKSALKAERSVLLTSGGKKSVIGPPAYYSIFSCRKHTRLGSQIAQINFALLIR